MTEEGKNVQIVRDMFAAFDRGDLKSLLNFVADKVEWRAPVTNDISGPIVWAKPRRTKPEVESFFKEYLENIKPIEMKPLRVTAKDDRVIVEGTERSRVISTGSEYHVSWVMLFTLKNGLVTLFDNYLDTSDVLKALGMTLRKAA